MYFDLHIHTARHSPDSEIDPFALVRRARQQGLDGIVITEHDWLWTEQELEELRFTTPGLVVLAGIEISAEDGHFLVYNVHDPFKLQRGIGVAELCREVHRQGGAVVAAHPFRWGQPFDDILREENPDLDGIEVMTNNMDEQCRKLAAGVLRQRPLAALGSSDAHREDVVGICYTEFDAVIRSNRELAAAIRARRATAHDRAAKSSSSMR
ncbi:MAG TPA: PHP domain-containing protein [Gemmataceae bacterium]|nr:PHP domain-containing protein [Gemmataceae bacterium]